MDHIWADFDRGQADFEQLRTTSALDWPTSTEICSESMRFGQTPADVGPHSTKFSLDSTNADETWPTIDQLRPEIGQIWPEVDQTLLEFDYIWPELDQLRPELARL